MAEIWQQTCEHFVGEWPMIEFSDPEDEALFDRTGGDEVDRHAAAWTRGGMRPVASAPGFFIADVRGRPLDVALVRRDKYGDMLLEGGYVESTLWLDRGIRGFGLAAELVIAKSEKLGGRVEPDRYTEAGLAAHRSAHRLAVQRAMREGFKVPDHVLVDYPELLDAPTLLRLAPGIEAAGLAGVGPSMGR